MKLDKSKAVFLLGGHDLEMLTIRELLQEGDYIFFDESQKWGAELGDYKDRFKEYSEKTFYAIELEVDKNNKELLQTYDIHIIDHHGDEHNGKPASILQILDLLGVKKEDISRDQELISANDARYILGMKCIGATDEEMKGIRKRDREAQGITKDDYANTKYDFENEEKDAINIIKTDEESFASIKDKLYFDFKEDKRKDKTIIYNDKKIVCYGFDLTLLKGIAREFGLSESDYYYGGGNSGYFGIKDESVDKYQIEEFKKRVIKKSNVHSSHIFMFPFRFDYAEHGLVDDAKEKLFEYEFYYGDSKDDIDNRIDLSKLNDMLTEDDWVYKQFVISKEEMHIMHNDFGYFYDYARDSLYNHKKNFSKKAISSFYRKKTDKYKGKSYTIDILEKGCGKDRKKATTYELEIEDITLRVFQTGIAILAIELNNYEYSELDDILRINDYGRRIYPQYIGEDKELTTKQNFLANYIQIGADEPEYFNKFTYEDIEIGNHIKTLLGKNTFTDRKTDTRKFYIQPSLDDRMFVLSWYENKEFVDSVKTCNAYKYHDDWYKYVFVDNDDVTVQNDDMKEQLLKDATYARWSKLSTIYGITRYSFVSLTDNGTFGKYVIKIHMRSMYFQMATLLLANRTSILRFSDEIAALVSPTQEEIKEKISLQAHALKIQKVYDIYSNYDSRIYFKEITHQDQGIELYTKGMEQMKIPEHHDKLDSKFTRLFDYSRMMADQASSDAMNRLSILGAIFLPASFVLGIFGLGIFNFDKASDSFDWLIFAIITISIFLPIGIMSFLKPVRNMILKEWLKLGLLLVMIIGLVFYTYTSYPDHLPDKQENNQTKNKEGNTLLPKEEVKSSKDIDKIISSKSTKEENNVKM